MREKGKVARVRAKRAEVDVEAKGECEHCSAHGICNWTGQKHRRVLAVNQISAAEGEMVELETVEGRGAKTNLLVFGVPVLGMLVGTLVGGLFFSDLWAGILAGIGLALGFGIVKIVDVRAGRSGRNLPVIVRRLTAEESKGASCETTADSDAAGRRDSR